MICNSVSKKNYLWHKWVNHQNLFKAKAGPKAINVKKILKYWVEQLANLLKNIKVNLHNKASGHYREMAWLPFQKQKSLLTSSFIWLCEGIAPILSNFLIIKICFIWTLFCISLGWTDSTRRKETNNNTKKILGDILLFTASSIFQN